ncbi:MAG TPA: GNAT family N-acetyltransferase [Polyangiaceae bacterium]
MTPRGVQVGFEVEPLDTTKHDRESFTCGVPSLDGYLKKQAAQEMRRRVNAVFILVETRRPTAIAGYFTLCASALEAGSVPESARKHLPRYPLVSTTLIGRFAVAVGYQGRGLGAALLARALRVAHSNAGTIGSCMVVVDALNEKAAGFYGAHGFVRLPDSMRLILPMRTIGVLLGG